VIHYDPWWNPAAEAQATDRAHRIGQDRPVHVYKLVARGTLEERILELQDDKRQLVDAALAGAGVTRLSADDLHALYRRVSA
jgi:SNF2 family DNA or RNA helicase